MRPIPSTLSIFIIILLLNFSCNQFESEEDFIPLELPKKPVELLAFLKLDFMDSIYFIQQCPDSILNYYTYLLPAKENGSDLLIGATLNSESFLQQFSLMYVFPEMPREKLIQYLANEKQPLAYGSYQGERLVMEQLGFCLSLSEYSSPNGPSVSYDSWSIEQTESSYFNIEKYYAGDTERTIWLRGSFKFDLPDKYKEEEIGGEFLMEFPLFYLE